MLNVNDLSAGKVKYSFRFFPVLSGGTYIYIISPEAFRIKTGSFFHVFRHLTTRIVIHLYL